jgi:hypothetical protein
VQEEVLYKLCNGVAEDRQRRKKEAGEGEEEKERRRKVGGKEGAIK